jgi:hypothetical protein
VRKRRISAINNAGHCRRRRRFGAVEPGTSAATLPPSALSLARHRNNVRPTDPEGLASRRQPMALPEIENRQSLSRIFGNHAPA